MSENFFSPIAFKFTIPMQNFTLNPNLASVSHPMVRLGATHQNVPNFNSVKILKKNFFSPIELEITPQMQNFTLNPNLAAISPSDASF